ncbi:MAG: 16S rRNA (cytosine(967)-C(5))-methyltransferase RsmB [Clostridia bacterium]|nr:16S rRNA (cytosine(967)-C(5))-methyltransferase RsmB [Lachnospiraceae bacterium]NCC00704.1 16S rRNA (cytosine(967)-C(5))-methyltransferase RsmB [Clostridia bacterium]NCD02717.1 16S rRNA (cytosine(967)-C(5))-methyltransferase RsmB [Clostridia bacterium]
MTNQENLRDIVCTLLLEIEKEGVPSHVAIRHMLEKYQYLGNSERRFISRLTRGTLERSGTLDWMIEQFSKVKVKKMKPVIRTILRISAYQMKYMDGVPVSAVCNEAVKLAKKRGFKSLAGFVNGVLRNMGRGLDGLEPPKDNLSVYYSQPEWLTEYWTKCYGEEKTREMFEYFLKEQPLNVRICKNRITAEVFKEHMEIQKVTAVQNAMLEDAFELKGYDYLGALPEFQEGLCTVQDVSSMLVAKAAGVKSTDKIIDVCAAPGGKSIQISEMLNEGRISARDLTENKIEMIEENIQRMGAEHIQTRCQDALEFVPEDEESADVVIADLPCSGLGVIGRKPDIKYRMNLEDMKSLAELQKKILTQVSRYVKPGGCLIYSTCTVNLGENEENVRWFQENFPFETESLKDYLPENISSDTLEKGYVQLFPGEYDTDGFFIARFRRR